MTATAFHPLSISAQALALFRAGDDTKTIAGKLRLREWTIERLITDARSRELGLPNPYYGSET